MKKEQGAVFDRRVGALSSVFVTVYNQGTYNKPTIYSDNGITPQANPFQTDSFGRFAFYVADGRYDIEFSGPLINTFRLEDQTIVDAWIKPFVSLKDYGAVGNGVANDSQAVQNAFDAAGGIMSLIAPPGNYRIVTGLTMSKSYTSLIGAGSDLTKFTFEPTGPGVLFDVHNAVAGTINCVAMKGIKLITTNDYNYTKTGLRLTDISRCRFEDISISGWSGNNSSIGLQLRGRDISGFKNFHIGADIPISIENNPDYATIDCDHFHFENMYMQSLVGPIIQIENGAYLSNLTFDGYQAWIPQTHGLYWLDDSSALTSCNLVFKNIRLEQTTDQAAYLFYINKTGGSGLNHLLFENIYGGLKAKGFYLRNVSYPSFRKIHYVNNVNNEALNVDGTVGYLTIINAFWQTNTTAILTGQYELFAQWGYTGPLPTIGFYTSINDIDATTAIRIAGHKTKYSTAAPTSGTWARGDVVWNSNASASDTPGWVCVTAGTPGVWKAMANLAA